ncbi:hypothetical protein SGM_5229 [Streptomyces griseoaurantiacus M045]|uniref:Uncharacterized protein n=1 Tax=Streptomyces griseoaurantiacus M045 TaxID=996637 RepID=F3NQF4_9ACTN|nr:hypothetical protein SGM_5229 [Streptomyces griseoaurantiacus M045]
MTTVTCVPVRALIVAGCVAVAAVRCVTVTAVAFMDGMLMIVILVLVSRAVTGGAREEAPRAVIAAPGAPGMPFMSRPVPRLGAGRSAGPRWVVPAWAS